jgi:hypothetical protein
VRKGGGGWIIFLLSVAAGVGLYFANQHFHWIGSASDSAAANSNAAAARAVPVLGARASRKDVHIFLERPGIITPLATVTV